jgi:uroporphyrinogen decarboxylase
MYGEPAAWHRLCEKLASVAADYLRAQVEAGVDAVQLFDSWVGALDARDYREFALPHSRRIFDSIRELGVPAIHFGVGTATIMNSHLRSCVGSVVNLSRGLRRSFGSVSPVSSTRR